MNGNGDAIIGRDTVFKGSIRNGQRIEIFGHVEGDIAAETLLIHESGRLHGIAKAENAEVRGLLQGEVTIKHLIDIKSSGCVAGKIRYGRIAMEPGGDLSAELRNIPPELAGDLDLVVGRGRSVVITTTDLAAVDPDDDSRSLTFHVSNIVNGSIRLSGSAEDVAEFTEADIKARRVSFLHDGSEGGNASFDVVVSDAHGGTSGSARTVKVAVTRG